MMKSSNLCPINTALFLRIYLQRHLRPRRRNRRIRDFRLTRSSSELRPRSRKSERPTEINRLVQSRSWRSSTSWARVKRKPAWKKTWTATATWPMKRNKSSRRRTMARKNSSNSNQKTSCRSRRWRTNADKKMRSNLIRWNDRRVWALSRRQDRQRNELLACWLVFN